MRDGQHVRAGLLLEARQVAPEVFRVLAVELGVGQGAVRHAGVAAEDHVAVQVVAADGGPLEADERGEAPRLVVLVRQRRVGLPGVLHGPVALDGRHLARQRGHDLHRRGEDRVVVAARQRGVPLLPCFRGQDLGIAAEELRHQAVHLGVVGDHEEVERAREPGAQPVRGADLLAAREAVGVLLADSAHRARIDRDRRVQVGIAEQDARRIQAPGIGRVLRPREAGHVFLGEVLLVAGLRPRAGRQQGEPQGDLDDSFHGGSRRVSPRAFFCARRLRFATSGRRCGARQYPLGSASAKRPRRREPVRTLAGSTRPREELLRRSALRHLARIPTSGRAA